MHKMFGAKLLGELWNQNFGMLVNLESSVFKTRIFTIRFHNETFTEFLGEDTIWTAHLQIKHNFSHHYIVCLAHCECTILEKIIEIDYLAAFSMYIHLNQHSWSEFHKLFPLNKKTCTLAHVHEKKWVSQVIKGGGRTHLYQVLVVLNSSVLKAQLLTLNIYSIVICEGNIFQKQVTGIIMMFSA
jgi:hypothetical protein